MNLFQGKCLVSKIAILTDTHFGARSDSLIFNEFFYDFYENQFFPYVKEHPEITAFLHLGDCLDRRKYINYKIAMDFRERFIRGLDELNIPCHFIVGNHDIYYKNTLEVNCYKELTLPQQCYVYDEPTVITINDYDMAVIPWLTSDNEDQVYGLTKEPGVQVAFGHLEISGFEMHSGVMSQSGISKSIFNKFDMVMSGHFHKRSTDGHIYYLGCPYQMSWADANDVKGFHVFDTETRELEFVPNERNIFAKIHYNDKKTVYKDEDVSQYDQKFIKLFVENRDDYYEFDKFLDRLYNDISVHDLKVVEDFSDLSVDFVSDDIVSEAQDTISLLDKYVEDIDTNLDKERIKSKLKSLYIEAGDIDI